MASSKQRPNKSKRYPSKVRCPSMEILLCVHAISVVRSSKFRCASMKISLCIHVNSIVRPCKWVAKTKKYSARQFLTNSEQKLLHMRPMSFLNFSWSNIFAISRLDLMGVIRHLKKKKQQKVAQTNRRTSQLRDWICPVGQFSEKTFKGPGI